MWKCNIVRFQVDMLILMKDLIPRRINLIHCNNQCRPYPLPLCLCLSFCWASASDIHSCLWPSFSTLLPYSLKWLYMLSGPSVVSSKVAITVKLWGVGGGKPFFGREQGLTAALAGLDPRCRPGWPHDHGVSSSYLCLSGTGLKVCTTMPSCTYLCS